MVAFPPGNRGRRHKWRHLWIEYFVCIILGFLLQKFGSAYVGRGGGGLILIIGEEVIWKFHADVIYGSFHYYF